ncbi:MAG: BlaI/MecI/CopY family transcriptional regulator, partial [Micromonosporaceae bacterium]
MKGFGELESVIMELLWSRDTSATVREIHTDLTVRRQLAYTTVLTVMDNLYKKGWLRREPAGRAYRYRPVMSREQHSANLMREALDASGDPGTALLGLIGQLSPAQAAALRAALAAHDSGADESAG